jgi:predicted porin
MLSFKNVLVLVVALTASQFAEAQFLMDMIDTSTDMGKGMLNLYSRFDRLRLSGYIQPQFQVAESKGARTFEGGDFAPNANSRFMLRRARVRIDYVRSNKNLQPSMQFVFQFDANERGFTVRDVWARLFENKWEHFALTTGIFARPFGYEMNLSSQDRESPERGRMSQTLARSERDLGAMLSFESRKKDFKWRYLKVDAGFFNGQGINGPAEFDDFKDFIGKVGLKPFPINKQLTVSGAFSLLQGGLVQNTRYRYTTEKVNGAAVAMVDSSEANVGLKNPRRYRAVDAQVRLKHKWGATEVRGEYWWGQQTGTVNSSETPAVLLAATDGYHVRHFNGAFVYFLQHIINTHHQLGVKFDFYDPNTRASGMEIGKAGSGLNASNIKYTTWHVGYNHYFNENVKIMLWYSMLNNEKTQLAPYTDNVKDNILTMRLQYRF